MSILAANLKHLYQRRGVWFWYLIILCLMPMVFLSKTDRYLTYLLISYFSGLMAGFIQREILSKPFSFCLPGHSEIPRRFVLMVGVVINGLLGFVFVFYPGLEFPSGFLVVLAGGVVGMMVYFFFAGMVFSDSHNNKIVFAFLFIIAFAGVFLKWDLVVQEMIVSFPLIVTSSGLLFCWLVWRWLGRESLSREYCGKMVLGMFDGWNKEKLSKYRLARLVEKDRKKHGSMWISSGVEGFFVSRISRAETGSLQQNLWGALYKSSGMMLSQQRRNWMKSLMLILPILCFLCYMPGRSKNIIFLIPGLMIVYMSLGVNSSLLICGGRRQRFWSALILAVATGIFVTVVVVFLAMATHLLERIMPPLTVRGHEFTFNALNMNFSLIPFIMIPVTLTIGLIFYKKPMSAVIFERIFQILLFFSIVGKLTIMNVQVQIGPSNIIIMLLCSWTIFVAVLRYISMRCCLVSQSR